MSLVFVSCEQKLTDVFAYTGILEVSNTEVSFEPGSSSRTIEVLGVLEWTIDTSSMGAWCSIDTAKNYKGKDYIMVKADSNANVNNRETTIRVLSGDQSIDINIAQLGNIPQIIFPVDSLIVGVDTNFLKIRFVTNIDYEINYDEDWIQVNEDIFEEDRRLLINISKNTTGAERVSEICLKDKNGEGEWFLQLRQLTTKAPYTPIDVDKLDPNKKLVPISATSSSEVDGKEVGKSFDGKEVTHFQSSFQDKMDPVILEYNFDGTLPLDYLCYIPYEGDVKKSFRSTEIWIKQEEGDYELIATHSFLKTGKQVLVFENSIENVSGVKFVVKTSYDEYPDLIVAACAEMEFYSTSMRYGNIFADPTYSTLLEDVELKDIFDITDPVFRNVAYHLYHDSYEEGRILQCSSYTDIKSSKYGFKGTYGDLDNVTGIVVKAGEEVPIFADNIKQNIVYATIFNPIDQTQMKRYRIFDGVNKIKSDYDGHLYINFKSDQDKTINIHIAGGSYNGYYDLSTGKPYDIINTTSSYLDVVGKHAHLLFNKEHFSGVDLASLVSRYDRIVRSQQVFIGLEKYDENFNNRVLFLEVDGKFEIRHINHYIECPKFEMNNLTDVEKISGKILWDIAVAVGTIHMHKDMNWKGMTFTMPKLFGLVTQDEFGESLEINNNDWYLDGFKNITIPEKKLSAIEDDYYGYPEKTVPFWQLFIYSRDVLDNQDLYKDIMHSYRKRNYSNLDLFFIKEVQEKLSLDLRSFFSMWGFNGTFTPPAYSLIAPPSLVYLTDENIDVFKKENENPTFSGYIKGGNSIIVLSPENIVAFLVKHNFYPLQVFDTNQFTVDNWKDSMRIFALGKDGTEVEVFPL